MYNTSDSVHNTYWTLDNEISKNTFAVHVIQIVSKQENNVNVVKFINSETNSSYKAALLKIMVSLFGSVQCCKVHQFSSAMRQYYH